jgi:ABC-2 type transport system ATP-binding protein
MSEGPPPVRLHGLTKYYGKHRGIEDVSLDVSRSEVLGLLGPNGAGKTTALRVLLGFLRPTSGSAEVMGFDVSARSVEVRRRVGYLPGDPALYGPMTGRQLLNLSMRARGLAEPMLANTLIDRLGAPMDREMRKCSRGMRQKVALVVSLFHDPEVIMLDEPTSGLDPLGQRALLEYLNERADAGRTVVLSSHVLSEVEQVSDRVAILRDGRLVTQDTIENIREKKFRQVTIAFDGEPPDLAGAGDLQLEWRHENRMTFRVRGDANALLRTLASLDITDVAITEPSLEDVFLDYYRSNGAT